MYDVHIQYWQACDTSCEQGVCNWCIYIPGDPGPIFGQCRWHNELARMTNQQNRLKSKSKQQKLFRHAPHSCYWRIVGRRSETPNEISTTWAGSLSQSLKIEQADTTKELRNYKWTISSNCRTGRSTSAWKAAGTVRLFCCTWTQRDVSQLQVKSSAGKPTGSCNQTDLLSVSSSLCVDEYLDL